MPQIKKISLFFQKTEAPDIFDVARYSLLKPDYDIGRIPTTQREIDLRVSKDKFFHSSITVGKEKLFSSPFE